MTTVSSEAARRDYATLDTHLSRVARSGGELDNHFTNHAPMVVEALCALGRGADAGPWLDAYASHLLPRPAHVRAVPREHWQEALGDPARESDWRAFFAAEIAATGVPATVRTWVPRLAPGFSASAAHGVIRTGHAVRALRVEDTPTRRDELAAALGYWAACFGTLPAGEDSGLGLTPAAAIERVPFLPEPLRNHKGSIVAALRPLGTWEPFANVAASIDLSPAPDATIDALAHVFARVYLANATRWIDTIVFVHALTGIAALAHLTPLLDAADARIAARYAWQTGAALYAVYGTQAPAPEVAFDAARHDAAALVDARHDAAALVDAAIATDDEHAIKVTEACLFFHGRVPRQQFLAVADHAIRILGA
jgi:hypothetical protein